MGKEKAIGSVRREKDILVSTLAETWGSFFISDSKNQMHNRDQ
jgi:hypothetical protein